MIDGWGIPSEQSPKNGDAITNAKTPVMDNLYKNADGFSELEASSLAVGLPEGLMGNSEVGHLNIGAGRVVWQDVVRIDQTIKEGKMNQNATIVKTFTDAKNGTGRLHLCGLISDGGVVSFPLMIPLMALTDTKIARQAGPSLLPAQGRQGDWCSKGLHPLLRRWT